MNTGCNWDLQDSEFNPQSTYNLEELQAKCVSVHMQHDTTWHSVLRPNLACNTKPNLSRFAFISLQEE